GVACCVALPERRDDPERRPHARPHVHDRRAHPRGLLAGVTVDRHEPPVRLHERIVPGQVRERPARSERRDRAIDESRVDPGSARATAWSLAERKLATLQRNWPAPGGGGQPRPLLNSCFSTIRETPGAGIWIAECGSSHE